jgi:hypothetical protein
MNLVERQQQFLDAIKTHFGVKKQTRLHQLFGVSNSAKILEGGIQLGVANLDKARDDPFSLLKWPRMPRQKPDPFTSDERERIISYWKTSDKNGCWIWNGAKTEGGYGHINTGSGHRHAHIIAYEHKNGVVAAGLVLDHLCKIRVCCNPDHLEAVPQRVNFLRGDHPLASLHKQGVCRKGHPRSEAYIRKGTNLVAYCKVCLREKRATCNS